MSSSDEASEGYSQHWQDHYVCARAFGAPSLKPLKLNGTWMALPSLVSSEPEVMFSCREFK